MGDGKVVRTVIVCVDRERERESITLIVNVVIVNAHTLEAS